MGGATRRAACDEFDCAFLKTITGPGNRVGALEPGGGAKRRARSPRFCSRWKGTGCCCYPRRLKNCTARSCFSAAARVSKVPRFRRRLVCGSGLREYSRYWPDFSLRIMRFHVTGLARLRALLCCANAVCVGRLSDCVSDESQSRQSFSHADRCP